MIKKKVLFWTVLKKIFILSNMKFTNFPCSPFIYNFENKNLYLIPLHVFRHSASPRPTSRCSTRTTRRIWDTSALSPSPGPERRPTDQDSVHSSSDHPPAAASHLSLIVLFLFYVRFFIIFLLCFMSVLTVVFFSLSIDLTVMFV